MSVDTAGVCLKSWSTAIFCLGFFYLAGAGDADAVRLTNNDSRSYAISVKEASGITTHDVEASQTLENFCKQGCGIILKGVEDGAYTLPEGNEIVSIEGGQLYYDGSAVAPDAKAE